MKQHAIQTYKFDSRYADSEIYELMQQWFFDSNSEAAAYYISAVDTMDAEFVEEHPLVYVMCSWMLWSLYRYEEAFILMRSYCKWTDLGAETPEEIRPVLGEAYIIMATAAVFSGNTRAPITKMYRRANELLPNGSRFVGTELNIFSNHPVIYLFDPKRDSLKKNLEHFMEWQKEVTKLTRGGLSGSSYLGIAELNYFTHNFADVECNARRAISTALKHQQYDVICSACFLLMRLHLAQGNYSSMIHAFKMLKRYAAESDCEKYFHMPDLALGWLRLKTENLPETVKIQQEESSCQTVTDTWIYGRDRVVYAQYLLDQKEYDFLVVYTALSIKILRKSNQNILNISLYIIQAAAYIHLREYKKANDSFEQAYIWCRKNNILMPVVELGSYIKPLVNNYKTHGNAVIPEDWLSLVAAKAQNHSTFQRSIKTQYERECG